MTPKNLVPAETMYMCIYIFQINITPTCLSCFLDLVNEKRKFHEFLFHCTMTNISSVGNRHMYQVVNLNKGVT